MANGIENKTTRETNRLGIKPYGVTLPMGSLSIGVDNIHHDVYLSPKFAQVARDYLFDLVRQNTSATYLSGIELRSTKPADSTAFRRLLAEMLQSSLTKAKYQKNIEVDLLFRLALLKFFSTEILNQFANVILECKEFIRKRGDYFERSAQAHAMKAKLTGMQSARRDVVRLIGQIVAQILADVEENVIAKARRALFGEEFAPYYELLKNRLIFLDGGKDDFYFLEHYVLLGNYARDPDRFEAMAELFEELLAEVGVGVAQQGTPSVASAGYNRLLAEAHRLKQEIGALEEQREGLKKKLERGNGLLNKLLSGGDPAELRAAFTDAERRNKELQKKLDELGPQIEQAKQQADFADKNAHAPLTDYLNDPENARRMFEPNGGDAGASPVRARLLGQLVSKLEARDTLLSVLASYEIRPIVDQFCPPVHLQQLKKAVVSKEEAKRVEEILRQVPARRLTMKPIEEISKKIRRYSREETQAQVLRFAQDYLRLHRDLRDAEHLAACMERINLITAEKVRELSVMNNRLYECVLREETKQEHDQVVSHVIIKADVRGSTRMTQDLLSRGLSPASHFSLNLHEPVKRLLDRHSAKKVFIEGDAIVLAIFETEGTQADARAVSKACVLSRQILAVCNSYNDRASTSELPPLEIGVGVAFQGSAPTYWTDGESRIMISKALNLSDRLSGCAKLAKRLLAGHKSHFSVFHFLTAMEGASAEELDEFLVRFNLNGIELNDEGFEKLKEEISLETATPTLEMPWGKEQVTLHFGEVPIGESVELLVLREGHARELLPDGKIGKISEHHYYEVCTNPVIYEIVFALKRTQSAEFEAARA
jgi:class 3 adenylate cyclase